MLRLFKYLTYLVILLIIIYSSLWYRYSSLISIQAESYLNELADYVGGEKSVFTYSTSSVKGYPFNFNINFIEPKFLLESESFSGELEGRGALNIQYNIFETKVNFTLPPKINFYESKGGGGNWLLRYIEKPRVSIKLQDYPLATYLKNSSGYKIDEVLYSDKGFELAKTGSYDSYITSQQNYVVVDPFGVDEGGFSLLIDIKKLNIDSYAGFKGEQELGDADFYFDISSIPDGSLYTDSQKKIDIRGVRLESDGFKIDGKGELMLGDGAGAPYGHMDIYIGNYQRVVQRFAALFNAVSAYSSYPELEMVDEKVSSISESLYKMSNERYNNQNDILILYKNDKKQGLRIGNGGVYEINRIFKNFSDEEK